MATESPFLSAVKESQADFADNMKNILVGKSFPTIMEKLMPVLDGVCHLRARARVVQNLIIKKENNLIQTGQFEEKIPFTAFLGDIDGESDEHFVPKMKQRIEERHARQKKMEDKQNQVYQKYMQNTFGDNWMKLYRKSLKHYKGKGGATKKINKNTHYKNLCHKNIHHKNKVKRKFKNTKSHY